MITKSSVFALICAITMLITLSAHAITMESLDKAINNIESTYKAVSDLTADFTQKTYIAALEKNMFNPGVIRWKKPGKFFIEYTGEKPKQYISNNKKIWVYVPGDTQVEVYTVSDKSVSKEALEFMRGFVDIKKYYNITGWKKKGNEVDFTLVPLFENAPYSQLKCHFGTNNLLTQVTIHNVSGNISTYNFANIRINDGISDDIFTFKKTQGVKEVSAN